MITDRRAAAGGDLVGVLREALSGASPGRVAVQLRDKELEGGALHALAEEVLGVCADAGAPLLVNDRADVARAVGADGVHLPGAGLPVADLRDWWPEALLGCSTHSFEEARDAAEGGASFVTAGPVWHTPSKERYGSPPGPGLLTRAATELPVYALGGVTPRRTAAALRAGAAGVACIRAVIAARDPAAAVAEFLAEVDTAREAAS